MRRLKFCMSHRARSCAIGLWRKPGCDKTCWVTRPGEYSAESREHQIVFDSRVWRLRIPDSSFLFMDPQRWQQIDQLFHSALERNGGERATFLAQACVGDESLRREVEALLASHQQAASFMEIPAGDAAADLL